MDSILLNDSILSGGKRDQGPIILLTPTQTGIFVNTYTVKNTYNFTD